MNSLFRIFYDFGTIKFGIAVADFFVFFLFILPSKTVRFEVFPFKSTILTHIKSPVCYKFTKELTHTAVPPISSTIRSVNHRTSVPAHTPVAKTRPRAAHSITHIRTALLRDPVTNRTKISLEKSRWRREILWSDRLTNRELIGASPGAHRRSFVVLIRIYGLRLKFDVSQINFITMDFNNEPYCRTRFVRSISFMMRGAIVPFVYGL